MPEAIWIKLKKQELHNRMKGILVIDRKEIRRGHFKQGNCSTDLKEVS